MNAAISAAVWVVGKALAPVSDGLLENWAASDNLGPNITALKRELLRAQGILYTAHDRDRDITNPALKELLHMLRQLADGADDVLDELDYFRIQDKLETTYDAADNHPGGWTHGLLLNVRHTAKTVANKFELPTCLSDAGGGDLDNQEDDAKQGCLSVVRTCGCIPIPKGASSGAPGAGHADTNQFPSEFSKGPLQDGQKMKFNRVEMSKRMANIVQQLDPICDKVKEILDLELRKPTQGIAGNRPKTTPAIVEPELFGRDAEKRKIVEDITHGNYCADGLTVLPVVGPGGIGKTTFTQHVYQELKSSFDVMIWVCVSLSFDANRLVQEIVKRVPEVNGEKKGVIDEELIEQRLKHKRFLLVLDDVWTYHEDEWKKLLAPFRKGEARGNMVMVTTRIPEIATMVKTTDYSIDLSGLGIEDFMHLFEAYVFGHQQSWRDHPELLDVGREIVVNLKGFPLAAKTVGRLLRNQLTLDHWTRVLESKEWELETSDYDIMPALKLSYDYLPFHLQQCFFNCALFPEDYKFGSKELVHLWIGLDILDSCGQRKSLEDVGLCYLNDLVNRGFFKKSEQDDGCPCYVVHDLLHELALKVSSSECLSISRSNVRYVRCSPSVRHLSIIIDGRDVNDRMAFEDFKRDLSTLHEKLKVENLQTVMLFGKFHGSFAKTFGDLFAEAKALRVILLSGASYNYTLEDVFRSLPRFLHLRYIRMTTGDHAELSLNCNISRFYHLRVLDVQRCSVEFGRVRPMSNPIVSVQKVSNLVKLRHFLVQDSGFELRQIAQLEELGGSLRIRNIENVERKEEANEANLIHKNHLERLILQWGIYQHDMDSIQEHVLESLKPHNNLLDLHIEGHRGATCPSWLGRNLSVKNLESLRLHDVGWKILPPLGEFRLVGELGEEHQSHIPSQSFQNLKRLELVKIPGLRQWVESITCDLFSRLEVLIVKDCPELMELPFSRRQSDKQEANMTRFPILRKLEIVGCPKLSSLPPIPWTPAACSAKIQLDIEDDNNWLWFPVRRTPAPRSPEIEWAGSGLKHLNYSKNYSSELSLTITGKGGQDVLFWNVLAFSNLADLKELNMKNCPPLPLNHLQKLTSLRFLEINYSSNVLSRADSESDVIYELPIERLKIMNCGAIEKELTQFLSHFQDLIELEIINCEKITRVGVLDLEQQQTTREEGEEELAAAGEGGLFLSSPRLQKLHIGNCRELSLLVSSLKGLRSLRKFQIDSCPKFLSSPSTYIWPLLAHWCLTELSIYDTRKFFASFEPPRTHNKEPTSCKLSKVRTDDLAGFLAVPICSLLSSSITSLHFSQIDEVECFTKEQEDALELLTSLQVLEFHRCGKLQCLPAALHRLSSLKTLEIMYCSAFESLPKDGLPTSLKSLIIDGCRAFKSLPNDSLPSSLQFLRIWCSPCLESLPKDSLPSSLQELRIFDCVSLKSLPKDGLPCSLKILWISDCPALKSLPSDGLPNSLRILDVRRGNNEELMRQCRKLKGTIPIIKD